MTRTEADAFPCECLCKFRPNDKKYVVATIVKYIPNNGWYEFHDDKHNSYCIAKPIAEFEAMGAHLKAKDEEIKRLKEYIEIHDERHLFKLAFNETVKELVVKPIVKNISKDLTLSRKIVAMLFWNMKAQSRKYYSIDYESVVDEERAFGSCAESDFLFRKAYKMLKEYPCKTR